MSISRGNIVGRLYIEAQYRVKLNYHLINEIMYSFAPAVRFAKF